MVMPTVSHAWPRSAVADAGGERLDIGIIATLNFAHFITCGRQFNKPL